MLRKINFTIFSRIYPTKSPSAGRKAGRKRFIKSHVQFLRSSAKQSDEWTQSILFQRTGIARSQPADTLATSLKFTAMYHAPGCTAARVRLYCRFSQGNSCKHTAPCDTLRVRGQCWRVIANQRVAARTILTAEVSARFALYEEQIVTVSCVGV